MLEIQNEGEEEGKGETFFKLEASGGYSNPLANDNGPAEERSDLDESEEDVEVDTGVDFFTKVKAINKREEYSRLNLLQRPRKLLLPS